MISHLHIQNYALIESLDISFSDGFSVITGETGAGKSILLGAIGLLLGQRADNRSIRNGAQKCTIEATFDISSHNLQDVFEQLDIDYDPECIIRRELTAAGKSRAFINDTPASIAQLKTLGDHLIDIHSQHQNLLLSSEDFQLNVLDILAHDSKVLEEYTQHFKSFKEAKKNLLEARANAEQLQTEQDYLQFQLDQLDEAALQEGEDQELETEQQTLEHAEEIKSALYKSAGLLNGDESCTIEALRTARQQLENISSVFPNASSLAERIESCRIELKDIVEEIDGEAEDIEYNPERQAWVDERLSLIYDLQRKHHVESVGELLVIADDLRTRLHNITHSEEHIQELEKQLAVEEKALLKLADQLTDLRSKAASTVEKEMCQMLIPLGMPNIRFKVEICKAAQPESNGIDKVTFLFSANKNATLQPISQIASGGEIARVMLSLKALISGAINLPTIIFDEIDTGVSGQIAERMAIIMKKMGADQHRQVISITHLPQIAALGSHHYRVFKTDEEDATNSHIIQLTDEERVKEIAHMLSGSNLTEAAMSNARALLNND